MKLVFDNDEIEAILTDHIRANFPRLNDHNVDTIHRDSLYGTTTVTMVKADGILVEDNRCDCPANHGCAALGDDTACLAKSKGAE